MPIIGRHLRRLIVIALVLGLSVAICCSPTERAAASSDDQIVGCDFAALDGVARLDHLSSMRFVRMGVSQQNLAVIAELESTDDDHVGDALTYFAFALGWMPQTFNRRRIADAISLRTLLSLGVCWRV